MTWSIRARLTLAYAAVLAIALTAFSTGVLWLHARWSHAQFDSELVSLSAATSRVMQEELRESGNLARAVRETRPSLDVPGHAMAILDPHGAPLVAEWAAFRFDPAKFASADFASSGFVTINGSPSTWRVHLQHESSFAGDYVVLVASALDELERQQHLLTRVLLVATPLIVLVTASVSWWVASSALWPMTRMAAQAEAITSQSPDWRLDAPAVMDELGQLARAFNQLLERLGTAAKTQRQFMADASHELRTPVSVIQTAAEVTLGREARDDWEYREALTIVIEQSARLSHMVEDMFVLARADVEGQELLTRRLLYLDEAVAECVRALAVVAATKNIQLTSEIQPDVTITGDDGLLRQLVTNLLTNAVQHTPAGGSVSVTLRTEGDWSTITIADTGPGISPANRERVFERFVRLDPARSTPGAGLGLPIARTIAERHGGTLTYEPATPRGAIFITRLPIKTTRHIA